VPGASDQGKANGAATPEDFERYAREHGEVRELVLPKSGLKVMVRVPNALRTLMIGRELERLPAAPEAEEIKNLSPEALKEAVAALARRSELLVAALASVMVYPKLSVTPKAGELDPNLLPDEDGQFLLRYSLGAPASKEEAEFFRGRGSGAVAGTGGPDVAVAAV
jgi:hypothetical protein